MLTGHKFSEYNSASHTLAARKSKADLQLEFMSHVASRRFDASRHVRGSTDGEGREIVRHVYKSAWLAGVLTSHQTEIKYRIRLPVWKDTS
jgi:hypothetical protein